MKLSLALVPVVLAALTGCAAEITSDSYYCGPAEACPPDLECDGVTNLCVAPANVMTFTCEEGPPLGAATCDPASLQSHGCILTPDGADHYTIATGAGCTMSVSMTLTFPVAFMPLGATIKDGDTVVATTTPCGEIHNGAWAACATFSAAPNKTYTLDVGAATGATTCGGTCGFNRFALTVQVTRP
ncbi:MAG TPA: hypothetical protein VL463_19325 [Kofleriaceae bacterium]|jgi:hypothetical protein|nr:hypothetical protein [Kofleriaceae bacterium]